MRKDIETYITDWLKSAEIYQELTIGLKAGQPYSLQEEYTPMVDLTTSEEDQVKDIFSFLRSPLFWGKVTITKDEEGFTVSVKQTLGRNLFK